MKKPVVIGLAILLVCLVVAGSTIAWLTAEASMTNTFTIGKIEISLEEPAWAISNNKIYPGAEIAKNPTITVKADSEDCYVYAMIDNQLNDAVTNAVTLDIDSTRWTAISTSGSKTLYRYIVNNSIVEQSSSDLTLPPLFTKVEVNSTVVTEANIGDLADKKIVVNAFAHQSNAITQTNADAAVSTHFGV